MSKSLSVVPETLTPSPRFSGVPFGFPRYPEFFEALLICAKHSTLSSSVEDIERVRNRLSPIWASTSLGSARREIRHLLWPLIQARAKFAEKAESVNNTRGPTAVLSELKQVSVLSSALSVFNQLSPKSCQWKHRENISSRTPRRMFLLYFVLFLFFNSHVSLGPGLVLHIHHWRHFFYTAHHILIWLCLPTAASEACHADLGAVAPHKHSFPALLPAEDLPPVTTCSVSLHVFFQSKPGQNREVSHTLNI